MTRTTKTITFSLPSEMADRLEELAARQGNSRSAFLLTAVVRYIEEQEWEQILRYGELQARKQSLGPEDVARLLAEHRSESCPP